MQQRILNHTLLGLGLAFAIAIAAPSSSLHAQTWLQTGQTCGGIGNLQCPKGQGCQYPTGKCSQPDLAGTCVAVADTCSDKGPQICGCDGTTYANSCEIAKAAVAPDHTGKCK